jgi:glyoxylase-like metal-dependent hydrolase (beta-lactamase superfamily II)
MTSTLNFNVFNAPEKPVVGDRPKALGAPMAWDPMSSTLIYGDHDAVLVDPLTTVDEAEALAAWVKLHHRNLTTIYITHGHLDHYAGVSIMQRHFPDARAIATSKAVEFAHTQSPAAYRKMFPGQMPASITLPEPYDQPFFELEGHELCIIEQGRTDAPDTTSLYVPDLGLIVTGDVVYNQCHQFVAQITPESLDNWFSALDRLADLNPTTVVAGHKKPGVPDTPECIAWTKQYLRDFDRLRGETASDSELYEAMIGLYPDRAGRQSWLLFGLA